MLTYSAEHDASKVMMGMEQSQNRHVCGGYRPRLDNFGMDFVPSTTLYVNVRHHRFQGCPIKIRVANPAVDRRCPSLLFYVEF